MKISTLLRALVALTLAASVLGACSSSSDDAGSDSGSGADGGFTPAAKPSGPAPTGEPIKIMTIAVKNNPILTQEQQLAAAQAHVDSVNAGGGLGGRPLELIACDSNLDPNQEQACIDQAISEKVSAIVGSTILFSDLSKLEAAKIPLLGNQGLTPSELSSPVGYSFANNLAWYFGIAKTVVADGYKKVGVTYIDTDAGKFSEAFVEQGLKEGGVETTVKYAHAATASDRSTDALAITKGDPEAIIATGTAEGVIPIIQAIRQSGYTKPIYTIAPDVNPSGIEALGATGDGIKVVGRGRFVSDTKDPEIKAYLSDIANFAPEGTEKDENGLLGWSGVDLFAKAMKDAKSFEGADVIAAVDALSSPVEAGGFGPFLGTGEGCVGDFPRVVNNNFIVGTLKDGVVTADGDFQKYC